MQLIKHIIVFIVGLHSCSYAGNCASTEVTTIHDAGSEGRLSTRSTVAGLSNNESEQSLIITPTQRALALQLSAGNISPTKTSLNSSRSRFPTQGSPSLGSYSDAESSEGLTERSKHSLLALRKTQEIRRQRLLGPPKTSPAGSRPSRPWPKPQLPPAPLVINAAAADDDLEPDSDEEPLEVDG